jgi:hypothetical protein
MPLDVFTRCLSDRNDFIAYIDAVGAIDGNRCLLEWKTTTSRYPEEPAGLVALDPRSSRSILGIFSGGGHAVRETLGFESESQPKS